MNNEKKPINHGPLLFLSLTMALGPLAALSVGSRYADEETRARASAASDISTLSSPLAMYTPSSLMTASDSIPS